MSTVSDVQLNQAICIVVDAKLVAREFSGLSVKPHQDEPWTYDICHSIDDRFDRHNVPLDELMVRVEDVKLELEAVYGEHAERLFDMPMRIELKEAES